jgi:hypothetical protein
MQTPLTNFMQKIVAVKFVQPTGQKLKPVQESAQGHPMVIQKIPMIQSVKSLLIPNLLK